jgi:probable O-glycosylation ligase (exosortase A-associated)
MRDLIFVGYLAAIMLLAFKRPFLFTLIYAYIDIVTPQKLSYFLLNSVPLSLIVFALAVLGFLVSDDKRNVRVSFRWVLMILLLAYCGYTTSVAAEPVAAFEKWSWVWKALIFAIFLPLTLHTRLRMEAVILTMTLCASALIVAGGIKTLAGGGGYGVLVMLIDDNTGLFEGSTISCIAIALIPLIIWLAKHGTIFPKSKWVNLYAAALIFSCLLIPIGTQARTGIVCIAVLAILTLRFARHRFLYVGGAVLLGLIAIPLLPQSFTQRADTIKDYKSDESASTRIAVWQWTWEYAKNRPIGGGFNSYLLNKVQYQVKAKDGANPGDFADQPKDIVDSGRAFHSSYFEMLGEQGFPGLFIWLVIQLGGLFRMQQIQRMYRKRNLDHEAWIAPLATALQHAQIIYLVGALFVGIAYQPITLMIIGVQIALSAYLSRRRAESGFRPVRVAAQKPNATQAG